MAILTMRETLDGVIKNITSCPIQFKQVSETYLTLQVGQYSFSRSKKGKRGKNWVLDGKLLLIKEVEQELEKIYKKSFC